MEDRSTWDYLTACLYHGPLDQPDTLWALVRHEELVRATESEAFKEAVAAHSELIRGPSPALRIRNHLDKKGLLLPRAVDPDPGGTRAKEAWASFREGRDE
jgi:hypothetical protein